MNSFIFGELVLVTTGTTPFTDALTNVIVDPTLVRLLVSVNGAAPTIYSYPGGDGTIVRDGVGIYHASLDTSTGNVGGWMAEWSSDPPGTTPRVCVGITSTTFNVYTPV